MTKEEYDQEKSDISKRNSRCDTFKNLESRKVGLQQTLTSMESAKSGDYYFTNLECYDTHRERRDYFKPDFMKGEDHQFLWQMLIERQREKIAAIQDEMDRL